MIYTSPAKSTLPVGTNGAHFGRFLPTHTQFGYLGAVYRYVTGEGAPVAKDVVNYMGENIQPGVKAVAKAVTEGIVQAQKEQEPNPPADA
jgi:hypothetical protein